MAEKRMFNNRIVRSDSFLMMPYKAQVLYSQLAMSCDDYGFVESPMSILGSLSISESKEKVNIKDYELLCLKKFIIHFNCGFYNICVIKHHWINNQIDPSKRRETTHQKQIKELTMTDNYSYKLISEVNDDDKILREIKDKFPIIDKHIILDSYKKEKKRNRNHSANSPQVVGKPSANILPRVVKSSIEENRLEETDTMSGKKNNPTPHIRRDEIKEIVEYLNEKAEKNFKHTSKSTQAHIKARLREGYTVEDFKTVIDKKVSAWWNDPKFNEYLRPQTLFNTKFESYLNGKDKDDFYRFGGQ